MTAAKKAVAAQPAGRKKAATKAPVKKAAATTKAPVKKAAATKAPVSKKAAATKAAAMQRATPPAGPAGPAVPDDELRSRTSRDRILLAAGELAKERGFAGATIARVCQRSGLPVSSVYWHFEDKDHLFAEVIRTSYARWLVSVPHWEVRPDTTLEEGLGRVLGAASRTFAEVPAFLRVGMQVLLETSEQSVKTRQAFMDCRNQNRRMITAWLSTFLPPGVDAEDLAHLVVAYSDGMIVGSQIFEDWNPGEFVALVAATINAAVRNATTDP